MTIDKKELIKLSPEERIKKLKSMEEDRKKEVGEIEKLIKDSVQELKTDKLAEQIAPEQKSVDISRLFQQSSERGLERTARQATNQAPAKSAGYQKIVQVYQDYSQLKEFYGMIATGTSLNREQINAIGQIGERINVAEKYMNEGEKAASKLNPSRAILYKLRKETGLD